MNNSIILHLKWEKNNQEKSITSELKKEKDDSFVDFKLTSGEEVNIKGNMFCVNENGKRITKVSLHGYYSGNLNLDIIPEENTKFMWSITNFLVKKNIDIKLTYKI
jgi:hypothetical protein